MARTQQPRKPRNTDRVRKALAPTRDRQAQDGWERVKQLSDAECEAAKNWINATFFGA